MKRRDFLNLIVYFLLSLAISGCVNSGSEYPNIVFIMADDMGYGDVGCYNPESLIPTPNMDRLAAQGMRFTDAHSPSALCSPTRYGVLTGRYCWRTRLKRGVLLGYDEKPLIEKDRLTSAGLLKSKGYETACIGKWHLGLDWPTKNGYQLKDDHDNWQGYTGAFKENEENIDFSQPIGGGPVDLGFDYFYGTAGCSTSDPPYCFIENRQTVSIPTRMSPDAYHKLPGFVPGLMAEDWSEEDVDPILTKKAIAFIENHLQHAAEKPFFLHFNPSSPHIPWLVPAFMKGKSGEGPRGDLIALIDWCVGRILETLDKYHLAENTFVIVTSDNGPQKGANGQKSAGNFRGYKAQIWEGGHRVPFIARWPGKIKPGTTCKEVISLSDMPATFAALTNSALPDNMAEDSFNILPAFFGESGNLSRPAVRIFHSGAGVFAIRKNNLKLIEGTKGAGTGKADLSTDSLHSTGQLYDLDQDPFEKNDLWEKEPKIVSDLLQLLEKIKQQGYSRQ